MSFRSFAPRIAVLCITLGSAPAVYAEAAQALPVDPALVMGELPNGLHYIVRKHSVPPDRAIMWVHMHTGSLNELENQRGIAHYLEHMAFNGSANFAPGTLVPFFQSLGMQFGRDQNAFTNFEQTTYQLTLPNVQPETLAKGLTFFSDVVGRLSLLPKEIDEERQIIQEERRRGLSGRQRTSFYVTEHIAPGSIFGQRITIGTEKTIDGVKEADFKDYYGKWYGASNATMMVVADTDPQVVVGLIKEKFGDLPSKPKPKNQELGVKAYEHSFGVVTSDPEIRNSRVEITHLEPARPPVTTLPAFRRELVWSIGEAAFNRRMSDKIAKGGVSFLSANASMGNEGNAIWTAGVSASAEPAKWKPALEELALELQRARTFGFTAREVEDVKKQLISGAERAVETEPTSPSSAFISQMNAAVTSGEPIMSATQRLELLKSQLSGIKLEEVSQAFAREFDPTNDAFVAILAGGVDVPSESDLVNIGTNALAVKPTQDTTETAAITQLMAELPTPGTIADSSEHAESKVWNGWLSNNALVHYRFMDDRKNEATIHIALAGGEILEAAENRGITAAAQLAWSRHSTQKFSSTDIREFMTGRKVNVRGGGGFGGGGGRGGRGGGGGAAGGSDTIALTVSGNPAELETGMQLAYLLLTQPKIEQAAFDQYKTTTLEMLQESLHNPMMLGMRTVMSAPYPENEPRTRPVTPEELNKITLPEAQKWLDKLIKESPIEVAIVGDIPKDKAIELATRYIGSLSSRDRISDKTYLAKRELKRPAGPRSIEKTLDTPTAQAFVFSGFYGADEKNLADARALNMAARILSTRMIKEVREDAQLVYSIGASSRAATTWPGFGIFSASAPTDPAKVAALIEKLASMYAVFAKDGPTDDEMTVAKKQMANTFEEQLKQPAYWSGQLDNLALRGVSLDDVVGAPAAYQAMTAQQVKDTFAKYYSKDNSITVSIKPNATDKPQTE